MVKKIEQILEFLFKFMHGFIFAVGLMAGISFVLLCVISIVHWLRG